MTREEVKRFLAVTDKGRWAEFFRTAIVTGMRPGELIGLRWDDIDFEHAVISVQRSLVWKGLAAKGWLLVPPKTKRGLRQIAIPNSLASALEDLRQPDEFSLYRINCVVPRDLAIEETIDRLEACVASQQ